MAEDNADSDVVQFLSRMILSDFNYYRAIQDPGQFKLMWTYGGTLCSIQENELLLSD